MRIPKSFQMMGHTIRVFYDKGIEARDGNVGVVKHHTNQIFLLPASAHRSRSQMEQTFWHEKVHAALNKAGLQEKMTEKEVDILASLLHQAQITEK